MASQHRQRTASILRPVWANQPQAGYADSRRRRPRRALFPDSGSGWSGPGATGLGSWLGVLWTNQCRVENLRWGGVDRPLPGWDPGL